MLKFTEYVALNGWLNPVGSDCWHIKVYYKNGVIFHISCMYCTAVLVEYWSLINTYYV